MKNLLWMILMTMSFVAQAVDHAKYDVLKGMLHKDGTVRIQILPEKDKFKVEMNYDVKKKDLVPVPGKLLKGKTVMEFPQAFRTEAGYKSLEKNKSMEIPKAVLKFVKRGDLKNLKGAYFLQVLPTNKKTKIDIVYHPSLPAVGWSKIKITFISSIPVLDGYVIEAELDK